MPPSTTAPAVIQPTLTGLIHGRAKTGKSMTAASLIKPLLYLDVELGAQFLPMAKTVWDPTRPPPKVDDSWDTAVVRVTSWDAAERAMDYLHTRPHPFRGFSVDSLQALQNRLITMIAGPTAAVEIQQWGEILRRLQNFAENLRDLTNHNQFPIREALVTCPTRLQDGVWGPYLRGQMGAISPYLFDITGYLFVEDEYSKSSGKVVQVRKLRTRRTKDIEAGERVGGKIEPIYTLPMVTGTAQEVRRRNTTFQQLRAAVYKQDGAGVAPAVRSETAPPDNPEAPKTDPTNGTPVATTARSKE